MDRRSACDGSKVRHDALGLLVAALRASGCLALLDRVRTGQGVWAPVYRRDLHEPVVAGPPVTALGPGVPDRVLAESRPPAPLRGPGRGRLSQKSQSSSWVASAVPMT